MVALEELDGALCTEATFPAEVCSPATAAGGEPWPDRGDRPVCASFTCTDMSSEPASVRPGAPGAWAGPSEALGLSEEPAAAAATALDAAADPARAVPVAPAPEDPPAPTPAPSEGPAVAAAWEACDWASEASDVASPFAPTPADAFDAACWLVSPGRAADVAEEPEEEPEEEPAAAPPAGCTEAAAGDPPAEPGAVADPKRAGC